MCYDWGSSMNCSVLLKADDDDDNELEVHITKA